MKKKQTNKEKKKKTGVGEAQTQPQQTALSPPGWWSVYGMNKKDNLSSQPGKIAQIELFGGQSTDLFTEHLSQRGSPALFISWGSSRHTHTHTRAQAEKQACRPVHPIWPDLNDSPTCSDSGCSEMNSIQCTVVFKKRTREKKKWSSGNKYF